MHCVKFFKNKSVFISSFLYIYIHKSLCYNQVQKYRTAWQCGTSQDFSLMTEIPRSYRSFAQIAEIPHRQAKHSVDMDLYLNEKDIKNIKIFDKKCECYEWFKIC